MRTYEVTVTETLTHTILVNAESCTDAKNVVKTMYDNEEIVLTKANLYNTEIYAERKGVCPICSAEIEYVGESVIDEDGVVSPWKCHSCGAHGDEGYTLHFDGHWNVRI